MHRLIRRLAIATAATALGAGSLLAVAAPASADVFPVNTAVHGRTSTSTSAPSTGLYSGNVNVVCQIYGSYVGSSNIWDKSTNGDWVPDYYVSTGTTGFKSGIPRCGGTNIPTGNPGTNPYPAADGPSGGYTARARWVKTKIEAQFPNFTCSTYDGSDSSDHSHGNAMDCAPDGGTAINQWPTLSEGERMLNLAGWVKENSASMKVRYIISVNRIWNIDRASEGWRYYAHDNDPRLGHYDHVHVSIQWAGN